MLQSKAGLLVEILRSASLTLGSAESCTGGLLGSAVTAVPGASEVYNGGVISYSNELKMRLLGVSGRTLAGVGAVSSEVAGEMARGARRIAGAALGVGITGIAGPGGGTEEKPAGLVFIAVASAERTSIRECRFSGGREQVRLMAVETALDMLIGLVKEAGI